MRRAKLTAMTALLSWIAAIPASAAWDHIGSVDFGFRNRTAAAYGNFGGSVEALMLEARDSDIMCNDVTATFGNGVTREIFRGYLRRGREVPVELPGQSRLVRRINFNCQAMSPRGGRVDIAADVGRYRDEWRQSPDWDRIVEVPPEPRTEPRTGDRVIVEEPFRGREVRPLDTAGWITLGSETFEGLSDRERSFAGWRGRDVAAIGLRPLDDDARCRSVTARFANGDRRTLTVDSGDMLIENRIFTLDIPGARRDLTSVDLDCHAEHGREVTIQVLAAR